MHFVIITPRRQATRTVNCRDASVAQSLAGLAALGVDHGTVYPGLAIVVAEDGLWLDAKDGEYFGLHGRLYAGNALLYGYDAKGETIDIPEIIADSIKPEYFTSEAAIEAAIAEKRIERPEVSIEGGPVFWRWPSKDKSWRERAAQAMAALLGKGDVLIDSDTLITTIGRKQ